MNKITLPYQQTAYFSKLMTEYLGSSDHSKWSDESSELLSDESGKHSSKLSDELKPFYNHYCDIDSFAKIIEERKQTPINRTVLVNSLTEQYGKVEISEATKNNIQQLKNENCFTVTTGHQLNLFTGPLYFIYKVVSAINLAKELKTKYPATDFVPVYWMATEDHDFEEVNHFKLFKKKYELANSKKGAVGQMKLEGLEDLLSELKEDLGDRNGVDEILGLFSKYYASEKTYAQAIKGVVNELFGKYGLVIIDGDDKSLKQLMIKEFENELLERTNHALINQTSDKLKELGFKPQVTPREINIFYLIAGLRERIVADGNTYQVLNTKIKFSEAEIIEELNVHPERFSPNAPMRCMYQEKVLPNLAYIGGGGELAYWLQLKAMFDANNISYPTLVLRNSVLFIDKGSSKRLTKLEIDATDLFTETDALIKNYLKKGASIILELKEEEKQVEAVFDAIVNKAGKIDVSLQPMIKSELNKTLKSFKNIENKLIKAEKKKEEVAINQIKNIKEKLFPNNSLQERNDNLISLLLFYGIDVIDELVEHLHPLEKAFIILAAE